MNEILTLAALPLGKSAYISRISTCSDLKERLTDLGLIPGTKVTCTARSPAGDPRAYLVRNTLIALRNADAQNILLRWGEIRP